MSAVRVRHRPPSQRTEGPEDGKRVPPFVFRPPSPPSDGFLEFLGCAEGNLLAGFDLNGFAGCRITAHARGALAHLEDAEAADPDPLTLFQVLDDLAHQAAE